MFALDSDACIEVLRLRNSNVLSQYRRTSPNSIVVPAIVAGELMVGAVKSVRPQAVAEVENFLSAHAVVPFGKSEFRIYAKTRADLERRGQKIGPNDLIVAATALSLGMTLVTHNTREFSRIPGLALADWHV